MITGFNTDVRHDGRIYHVQTEDRGSENPVLESLVYIGGTVVAKKSTPYSDRLSSGATEETIAALLKRQHQVIIAAIKAGRIEDLIKHSSQDRDARKVSPQNESPASAALQQSAAQVIAPSDPVKKSPAIVLPDPPPISQRPATPQPISANANNNPAPVKTSPAEQAGALDLDQVIADYVKRNLEQGKLDLNVITPNIFVAGKSIGLRIQVAFNSKPEPDAVVTVKVIGTAFKPQVYIGRAGRDGVASFNLTLPAFTSGTAALVIEGQSGRGRGELKHLIRRA